MSSILRLQIGPHGFSVRVEEKDKPAMLSAARTVEKMLDEKRGKHKVVDNEHLALMVALELALTKGKKAPDVSVAGADGVESVFDECLEILGEA